MSKNFQELLDALNGVAGETEDLAKAMPEEDQEDNEEEGDESDDAAIAAAAADGEGEPDGDEPDALGKSFEFVDAEGNKQQAVDATELVKSLMDRQAESESNLAKALETFTGVVQKQGDLIKSLTAQVKQLSSQGRGRKAVLNIAEKPDAGGTMAKSDAASEGMKPEEFFAKANSAFDAGKLSGKELNVISVCLRSNHPVDPGLINKVIAA